MSFGDAIGHSLSIRAAPRGTPVTAAPPSGARPPSSIPAAAKAPATQEDTKRARLGRLLEMPLPEAREAVLDELDRAYVAIKRKEHGGNVSRAAEAMGISRQLARRLIDRHGLKGKTQGAGDGE